jgi:hypothetical protein
MRRQASWDEEKLKVCVSSDTLRRDFFSFTRHFQIIYHLYSIRVYQLWSSSEAIQTAAVYRNPRNANGQILIPSADRVLPRRILRISCVLQESNSFQVHRKDYPSDFGASRIGKVSAQPELVISLKPRVEAP